MIKLSAREIMEVIGKEIMWCEENPDRALSAEYRKGFINGLIQARYLIVETDKKMRSAPDDYRKARGEISERGFHPYIVLGYVDSHLIHVLRNPWGYHEDYVREVRIAAAARIEQLKDAYENMRQFAEDNGLDTATRGDTTQ